MPTDLTTAQDTDQESLKLSWHVSLNAAAFRRAYIRKLLLNGMIMPSEAFLAVYQSARRP
jgi:hypothetical protein